MTEMKARLVDKDGNPLGTAANPLKISDHSISTATWGSITGTLSDQTDLNTALNGKASKTESDLTLYVYEDATGDADGSSKANAYTTLQAAIDAIPDVAQNVTVIVCKGSTNYLGQTTTIQKASVKSLTIQGEYYWYANCDANASTAGRIVDADIDTTGMAVGDRVVCTHYSGTVGSSSIDDYFYATITEVGEGYIQTSEETKVPTTGWKYLINQTVFDGNNGTNVLIIPYSTIEVLGITFENNTTHAIRGFAKSIRSVIQNVIVKNTGGISADMILSGAAFINSLAQSVISSGYGRDATIENVIIHGLSNVTIYGGMWYQSGSHTYAYCGFFNLNIAIYSPQSISPVSLGTCYIDSTCTTGAYGYNITLSNCTNNATTPVYNLTSGGSIEEWDGLALNAMAESLLGETTADGMRGVLASPSSTTKALSILVYDGTPSAGDLTTYDEIYTTPALCFAALPAIINHAVTITIREADGSAYAAATLQRVVAGGSITIQGEYYYNNTVASAGSGTGKFNVIAGHSGLVQAGDKVFLMRYSGTVGASTPSDAFVDTVAGVSGTEITLTTRTTDAFDTSWRYVVVRTITNMITVSNTDNVTISGLNIVSSSEMKCRSCNEIVFTSNIFEFSSTVGLLLSGCVNTLASVNNSFISSGSTILLYVHSGCRQEWGAGFYKSGHTSYGSVNATAPTYISIKNSLITSSVNNSIGISAAQAGVIYSHRVRYDGTSSEEKIAIAQQATGGGIIFNNSSVFGSNITTQKSPANWAATTDGSYIS